MTAPKHSQLLWTIPVLSLVCLLAFPAPAQFDGGNGTTDDPYRIATVAEQIDQSNLPEWTGGWTHVGPAVDGRAVMWQTFTPTCPNLTAVEIDILTISPGRGDDVLTVEIAQDGAVLASAQRAVEDGFDGLLRFEFTEAVPLVPEQLYELAVRDTGKTRFGWKYGPNTYERGSRYVLAQQQLGDDWFFRTYAWVELAATKYSGGTGEPNDPYQIATAADLIALGETPEDYDKHFILTADIDLDPNLPGGKVFDRAVIAPDTNDVEGGFQGIPFTGAFDGNSHAISHLTIIGEGCLGLFGQLRSGAIIRSLGVEAADVNGTGDLVGGLAGQCGEWYDRNLITNCYSTGSVSGNDYVGGLIGFHSGIEDCYSVSIVTGNNFVGGLVGSGSIAAVSRCYNNGSVNGKLTVGGLIGYNRGRITDCYSTATVNGDQAVGGLVGENLYMGGRAGVGRLVRCYSVGMVNGNASVGGLVGEIWRSTNVVRQCFWDIETSGQATSAGGVGMTTGEMQTAKTFLDAGWGFVDESENGPNDVWKIAEGLDYPRLWWEPYDGRVTAVLGQVFTVTLESNPSTGYRWEWVDHQDSIVEQMGEAQFKPRETGDPPLVGAGGWESFDFKAVQPGQMTLRLVYRRPWEEGVEPPKTFSLHVTVP
jgi:predicted secreted protein